MVDFTYDPTAADQLNNDSFGTVQMGDPTQYGMDPTQFFYQPTPSDQLNNDSWANQQFGNPGAYGLTTGDLGIGPTCP